MLSQNMTFEKTGEAEGSTGEFLLSFSPEADQTFQKSTPCTWRKGKSFYPSPCPEVHALKSWCPMQHHLVVRTVRRGALRSCPHEWLNTVMIGQHVGSWFSGCVWPYFESDFPLSFQSVILPCDAFPPWNDTVQRPLSHGASGSWISQSLEPWHKYTSLEFTNQSVELVGNSRRHLWRHKEWNPREHAW